MKKIQVRRVNLEFPQQIEKHWFGKSAFKTHLLNSFTLFVPDLEQYLIRNVKKSSKQIENEQLKQEAQAFIGQEAQHLIQHTKFWDNLRSSGYQFDGYLYWVRIFFNTVEHRFNLKFNLALSAGIEHLTSLFAERTLENDFMAEAEPELKQLFEWHAAEEIEHKTVLYDVLQNETSSYLLRILGLFIANIFVLLFLNLGLVILLYQDKKLLDRKVWQEMIEFWFTKDNFLFRALLASIDYLRKDFHPSQRDNLFLIEKVSI